MPGEDTNGGGVSAADDTSLAKGFLDIIREGLKDKKIAKASKFDEARKAEELRGRGKPLAKIKCVGKEWYSFHDGYWEAVERARFGPVALASLPKDVCTARNAQAVLDHVEMATQTAPTELKGFYQERIDEDGIRSFLINVRNGVLEVFPDEGGMVLKPHDEKYGFTLQAAAAYEEKAKCPRFEALMREQLPDEEDHALLQCFAGSILCPTAQFEAALVSLGPGGIGKSKLAMAVANTLTSDKEGGGLVTSLSINDLCDRKGYSLPKLSGSALNLGTEVTTLDLEDSSNFKALISGERVEARSIYGKPFSMRSTTKHWFLANEQPRFKNGSSAEGRRLRFVRFEVEPRQRDTRLLEKLTAERDGVFLWMVRGLINLMAAGSMPAGSKASRQVWEQFELSNDSVSWFVKNRCVLDPEAKWKRAWALSEFENFLTDYGLTTRHAEDWFFKRLYQKYQKVGQVRSTEGSEVVRYLTGIRLKREGE